MPVALWPLRDGPFVHEATVLLALSLEERGHAMSVKDGKLIVGDGSRLTADDSSAITRERLHMLALVGYCQEGHEPR